MESANQTLKQFPVSIQQAMESYLTKHPITMDLVGGISGRHAAKHLGIAADELQKALEDLFTNALKTAPVMKAVREQLILDIGGADAPLDLRLKAINAQYDDYKQQLIDLGATTAELIWLEGQRNKIIDETTNVLENSINAWEGVTRSIQDQIYSLKTGGLSPLSLTEQMGITQSTITGLYGKGSLTTEDVSQLQGLYSDLLGIGKELYSPVETGQIWRSQAVTGGQYETLFNETISALESLSGFAEMETDVHLHLYIDGDEIGYTVAKQTKTNPELIAALQGIL